MNPDDPDFKRAARLAWDRSFYDGAQDQGQFARKKGKPDFDTFMLALRDELRRVSFIQEVKQKR